MRTWRFTSKNLKDWQSLRPGTPGTWKPHRRPGAYGRVQRYYGCCARLDRACRCLQKPGDGGNTMNIDPIELAIFKSTMHSVAEEMGAVLRRTAFSQHQGAARLFLCRL